MVTEARSIDIKLVGNDSKRSVIEDIKMTVAKNPKLLHDRGVQALGFEPLENVQQPNYHSFVGDTSGESVFQKAKNAVLKKPELLKDVGIWNLVMRPTFRGYERRLKRLGVSEMDITMNTRRFTVGEATPQETANFLRNCTAMENGRVYKI